MEPLNYQWLHFIIKEMTHKRIAQKLVRMVREEQRLQLSIDDFNKKTKKNSNELNLIIKKIGWPNIEKVGKQGAEAAWLIAQHSDGDINFQKRCLKLIEKEIEKNAIPRHYFAYLYDRICINLGKTQLYGTQLKNKPNLNIVPYPIRLRSKLNERRRLYNLPPLDVYIKLFKQFNNK